MFWTRRQFLKSVSAASLGVAMPPLFLPAHAADGFFELRAGPSKQKLYKDDGPTSDVWSYNGTAPGPEIRVRRGERVKVRFINNLDEPSTIHWHGIRIANAMDGVPGLTQEAVEPGGIFEYDFVAPDAGTYWYHSHNRAWSQVARGLYGPLIVEEDDPSFDRDHDLTLVIDDWRLQGEGSLETKSMGNIMEWAHGGRLGNWITVNGKAMPTLNLEHGTAYRLRLINVCNARVLAIDPNQFSGHVIAYDGQNLGRSETLNYSPLLLGPAQRVDLLVSAKKDFRLEELSGDRPYSLIDFKVDGSGAGIAEVRLPVVNALPEPELAKARRVKLDMTGGAMGDMSNITYQGKALSRDDIRKTGQVWAFNGIANLPDPPLFTAKAGETMIIEVQNNTQWPHAMHVHGHHFRVIKRSGSDTEDGKPWRDTFLIGPGQTTDIGFVADNKGKWLFHCHMLEHAAAGMVTWFEVA